jgi:hypothetical protein
MGVSKEAMNDYSHLIEHLVQESLRGNRYSMHILQNILVEADFLPRIDDGIKIVCPERDTRVVFHSEWKRMKGDTHSLAAGEIPWTKVSAGGTLVMSSLSEIFYTHMYGKPTKVVYMTRAVWGGVKCYYDPQEKTPFSTLVIA